MERNDLTDGVILFVEKKYLCTQILLYVLLSTIHDNHDSSSKTDTCIVTTQTNSLPIFSSSVFYVTQKRDCITSREVRPHFLYIHTNSSPFFFLEMILGLSLYICVFSLLLCGRKTGKKQKKVLT